MAITPLPPVPLRSDTPANFIAKADAFLAALDQFRTEANTVAQGMSLNAVNSNSTTSVAIGLGAKSFTVQTGKSYVPGMTLKIASSVAPTIYMIGDVVSYSSATGALSVNVVQINGTGTVADWTISQSAPFIPAGIAANNLVQLDATARLPAVDGSQLTGIFPLFKCGTFTKANTDASGATLTVSGLGFLPKLLMFAAVQDVAGTFFSNGSYDGTTNACVVGNGGGGGSGVFPNAIYSAQGSLILTANVTAMASGQFTLTWTKTGSPTGNTHVMWQAIGK